jgi:hypothetical protein
VRNTPSTSLPRRRRRLAQLRAGPRRPRFGSLLPISRDAFVREVTGASLEVDVCVLLSRDALPSCAAARDALAALAASHPRVKCVVINASEAVGGHYPDTQLPTLLLYRRGDVALTLVGTSWAGSTLRHVTPAALAAALDAAPGGRVCRSAEEEEAADEAAEAAAERGAERERARAEEAPPPGAGGGGGIAAAAAARNDSDEDSDFSD